MSTITNDELQERIEKHRIWLRSHGVHGERLHLRDTKLSECNLAGREIQNCILINCDLSCLDLRGIVLSNSILNQSSFRYADLSGAILRDCYLGNSSFRGATARGAIFTGSDMGNASLGYADLVDADFSITRCDRALFEGANLTGACLHRVDLEGARLADVRGICVLAETDHGYRMIATRPKGGEIRIVGGCRDFSIDDAIKHYDPRTYRNPITARRVRAAIEWLRSEIELGNDVLNEER